MLEYSVNNQTFFRCKSQGLNWLERESLKITDIDLGSDLEKDIEEIKLVLRDEQVNGKERM